MTFYKRARMYMPSEVERMGYKICNHCNVKKKITQFHKRGGGHRRASCSECYKVIRRSYEQSPFARYNNYKRDAKRRGIKFLLTRPQFCQFEGLPCYYCGGNVGSISLDRVDNDRGYEPRNVVSCCYMCNSLKYIFDEKEFLNHINKIYTYQQKKVLND